MWFQNRRKSNQIFPDDLCFGDTINSSPINAPFSDVPTQVIRGYQLLHLYRSWRETHSVKFVGDAHGAFLEPYIFEFTWPSARFVPFKDWYSPWKYDYTVHRYADAIWSDQAEDIMLELFKSVDGVLYDAGSLVDFIIQDLLGYPTSEWHQFLDFGKQNMVCSVVCRAAEVKAYEETLASGPARRPGGSKIHIERTPPALLHDHCTYLDLGSLAV